MELIEYVVIALAASTVADCVLHGEIFAIFRALLQTKARDADTSPESADDTAIDETADWPVVPTPWWFGYVDKLVPSFFAKAWTCSYCIQFHAAAGVLLLWVVAGTLPNWAMYPLRLLVVWWAIVRLIYVSDAYLPHDRRFEREDTDSNEIEDERATE